jgi:hypothetical protein
MLSKPFYIKGMGIFVPRLLAKYFIDNSTLKEGWPEGNKEISKTTGFDVGAEITSVEDNGCAIYGNYKTGKRDKDYVKNGNVANDLREQKTIQEFGGGIRSPAFNFLNKYGKKNASVQIGAEYASETVKTLNSRAGAVKDSRVLVPVTIKIPGVEGVFTTYRIEYNLTEGMPSDNRISHSVGIERRY